MINRERCRKLRAAGHSIDDIARSIGLSKSTVQWHVRDVALTKTQREKLRRRWRKTMQYVNAKRRGKSIKHEGFSKPGWSVALVELLAHLLFDGRIDHDGLYYYNKSIALIHRVKSLCRRLLGADLKEKTRFTGIVLYYYNVEIADYLKGKTVSLIRQIRRGPSSWKSTFLKAFFDDEGNVYYSKSTRRIRGSQKSAQTLLLIQALLRDFGIGSRLDRQACAIEVTGKEHLRRFRDFIGFSEGVKINPDRKNGLWKEPFEKQQLLELALDSYQTVAL